jgi:hypothetical protein
VESTRTLLLKAVVGDSDDAAVLLGLAELRAALGVRFAAWDVYRGVRTADLYVYGALDGATHLSEPDLRRFESLAGASAPFAGAAPTMHRLERVFALPGASAGAFAGLHYVVEMDPAEGWKEELFQWYDTEHMPGLAAVPGCARAQRFLNPDGGPYSHACYGLTDFGTLESPPWLAVRHTAWSERVRPHFRNTRRTQFRALAGAPRIPQG